MTWVWPDFAGGETRDILIEGAGLQSSNCTIITSPVKTGTGALQIASGQTAGAVFAGDDLTAAQHKARISVVECQVNFDGNPTSAIGLISGNAHGAHYLEVGTDRRVRIGRFLTLAEGGGGWANRIPLTPWSVGVLGNGAYTHLVWVIDCLTLGSNHVWMTVIIDGITQIAQDVGAWVSTDNFGWRVGTFGIDAGIAIRLDDVCGGTSTSAADAPHLAALPIALVDAQHPATDTGASLTWTRYPGTGESYYQDWDDATGNDGDTTCLAINSASTAIQTSGMETLATLGWAAGAVILENGTGVGPLWSVVHNSVSVNKFTCNAYSTLSADVTVTKPGSTYEGKGLRLTRSGGGSWARADLDSIFAGGKNVSTDGEWRITSLMLQWLYSEASLALTPRPTMAQATII